MNLTSRLEKRKEQKRLQRGEPHPRTGAGGWLCTSTWILLGLSLALAGVGTLAVLEFTLWNKVPPALVGLWEVQEGPQKDSTYEFFRNGTMEVWRQSKKKDVVHKMQVTVRGRTLVTREVNPLNREESKDESKIRELTANTLILEHEKGDVLKMVRLE